MKKNYKMRKIFAMLLASCCLSQVSASSEGDIFSWEPTEEDKRMAQEPDFCVRLAKHHTPEVVEQARPFIERFLNPATLNGYAHPLVMENFDVASIISDTMALALDRENETVVEVLSPVFESDVSPRTKAETARLVTTLPLGDQEGFVTLWKAFYEKNAHHDIHEKIVRCVAEAEGTEELKSDAGRAAFMRGQPRTPYVFEGHTLNSIMGGGLLEGVPVMSLIQASCPLETFLIDLSEVLFLFSEEQRLNKTEWILAQYPGLTQAVALFDYVMEEGDIDKELHRLITFLSPYGRGEFEIEGEMPSIMWWIAGVSPIITLEDMKDFEKKVRKILESNDGIVDRFEFNEILRQPHLKWVAEQKKST
ncbi:MAG: hypothetical protein GW748_04870 [Alphaproteobacteria bacterium]|nr:hypothetical protein [Alphaproteobacteria bacterium]NCQ67058.1 hypothetical protein [Alphaproteobacteria bacterium]NCT07655.1 hypothetical protein [Alphaproteobacteria bacterium]